MLDNKLFSDKIKTMTEEELTQYDMTARLAGKILSTVGVITILLILIFTNIWTIITGGFFVLFVARMSAGISASQQLILARLSQMGSR